MDDVLFCDLVGVPVSCCRLLHGPTLHVLCAENVAATNCGVQLEATSKVLEVHAEKERLRLEEQCRGEQLALERAHMALQVKQQELSDLHQRMSQAEKHHAANFAAAQMDATKREAKLMEERAVFVQRLTELQRQTDELAEDKSTASTQATAAKAAQETLTKELAELNNSLSAELRSNEELRTQVSFQSA